MTSNLESQWKKLLQQTPFPQCVGVWEEILGFLENQLDEALGKEEEEEEEKTSSSLEKEDWSILFTQLLFSLEEQEEKTLKAPEKRWEALRHREVKELEKLTLAELLSLYELYLVPETSPDVPLDYQFQKLLEERKTIIKTMIKKKEFWEMEEFFLDCSDRKVTIATFLILLDLVFRKELQMKKEGNSKIYFGKIYSSGEEPS